jgi:hypothetical protein
MMRVKTGVERESEAEKGTPKPKPKMPMMILLKPGAGNGLETPLGYLGIPPLSLMEESASPE